MIRSRWSARSRKSVKPPEWQAQRPTQTPGKPYIRACRLFFVDGRSVAIEADRRVLGLHGIAPNQIASAKTTKRETAMIASRADIRFMGVRLSAGIKVPAGCTPREGCNLPKAVDRADMARAAQLMLK